IVRYKSLQIRLTVCVFMIQRRSVRSSPNLNRLVVFAAVVEAGSLTGAAKRLGLTKTVVSSHLKKLEEELGVTLIGRTTRRMRLTDIGRELHERIQGPLVELMAGAAAARDRSRAAAAPAISSTSGPWIRSWSSLPMSVRRILRVVRPISVTPNSSSSFLRCELTTVLVSPNRFAAPVSEPASTTAANTTSRLRFGELRTLLLCIIKTHTVSRIWRLLYRTI